MYANWADFLKLLNSVKRFKENKNPTKTDTIDRVSWAVLIVA